jgi:hypothetical protein
MKKLSPFSYCNFFKLKKWLRTFVGVNQIGGRIFGHFWPDNPPPRFFGQFWLDNLAWDAVTVIFMGGGINTPPLLLPWAASYSLSLLHC